MQQQEDDKWMRHAMMLAARAEAAGEVPVGAVLVRDGQQVAEGWNLSVCHHDPTAHAEIRVLQAAGQQLGNYRLIDTTLYVTLEPCIMCTGALIHARIGRLVYGAADLKTGAVQSVFALLGDARHNHQIPVTAGVLADECSQQLSAFFARRREEKRAARRARQLSVSDGQNSIPS
jgi:tRNA(adenine34) deaminase